MAESDGCVCRGFRRRGSCWLGLGAQLGCEQGPSALAPTGGHAFIGTCTALRARLVRARSLIKRARRCASRPNHAAEENEMKPNHRVHGAGEVLRWLPVAPALHCPPGPCRCPLPAAQSQHTQYLYRSCGAWRPLRHRHRCRCRCRCQLPKGKVPGLKPPPSCT